MAAASYTPSENSELHPDQQQVESNPRDTQPLAKLFRLVTPLLFLYRLHSELRLDRRLSMQIRQLQPTPPRLEP